MIFFLYKMLTKVNKTIKRKKQLVQTLRIKIKKGADFMKKEYKVTRHVVESTEEEKEIVYKQLANLFINMALKEKEVNTNEKAI